MTWGGGFANTVAQLLPGQVGTIDLADSAVTSIKLASNLQSDNYVTGVSGWRILRNTGNAEFNDVTVRGTIFATAGELGTLAITGTLTMGAGAVFRTKAAGARLQIDETNSLRVAFFSGIAGEITPAQVRLNPAQPEELRLESPVLATGNAGIVLKSAATNNISMVANTLQFFSTAETLFKMNTVTAGRIDSTESWDLGRLVTGNARVQDSPNSAGFPAYSFQGNTGIGMYRKGVGELGFSGTIFTPNLTGSAAGGDTVRWFGTDGQLFHFTSSRRYKKRVTDWAKTWAIDDVYRLRPVSYETRKTTEPGVFMGLIAEEVYELFPELVNLDSQGRPNSIMYDLLGPPLLAAIQDLDARLTALEGKL